MTVSEFFKSIIVFIVLYIYFFGSCKPVKIPKSGKKTSQKDTRWNITKAMRDNRKKFLLLMKL